MLPKQTARIIAYKPVHYTKKIITIKIGAESGVDQVKDCSVIIANYKVKGETVGKVGLIGPTRMDYATAVSMLNTMALTLEEAYQESE